MLKMLCYDIAVEIRCHLVLLIAKADIHFRAPLTLLKRAISKGRLSLCTSGRLVRSMSKHLRISK